MDLAQILGWASPRLRVEFDPIMFVGRRTQRRRRPDFGREISQIRLASILIQISPFKCQNKATKINIRVIPLWLTTVIGKCLGMPCKILGSIRKFSKNSQMRSLRLHITKSLKTSRNSSHNINHKDLRWASNLPLSKVARTHWSRT